MTTAFDCIPSGNVGIPTSCIEEENVDVGRRPGGHAESRESRLERVKGAFGFGPVSLDSSILTPMHFEV